MKKAIAICLTAITFLTACGKSSTPSAEVESITESSAEAEPSTTNAVADEIGEHKWQLGHILTSAEDDNYQVFATNFATNVVEYSGGKMTIEVIPNAQLGGERDMIEGMQLGTIEMALLSSTSIGVFNPKFLANDLPFIYSSQKMAWNILDGELGREMLDSFEEQGVKGLAWAEGGFRHLVSSKRAVSKLEDIVGLKVRCMENELYIKTYQTLGASPTPMAWTETFTAVQQGTVDGLDVPIGVAYSNKYQTIAPYFSMTGHFYNALIIGMSMTEWNSLNAVEQDVLMRACIKAGQDQRQFNVDLEQAQIDDMVSTGAVITTDIDFAAFQDKLAPVYAEYGPVIGQEFVDRMLEATKNWKE